LFFCWLRLQLKLLESKGKIRTNWSRNITTTKATNLLGREESIESGEEAGIKERKQIIMNVVKSKIFLEWLQISQ
jgi:hypothetical protein